MVNNQHSRSYALANNGYVFCITPPVAYEQRIDDRCAWIIRIQRDQKRGRDALPARLGLHHGLVPYVVVMAIAPAIETRESLLICGHEKATCLQAASDFFFVALDNRAL